MPGVGIGALATKRATTRNRELELAMRHPISGVRMMARPHPRDVSPPNLSGAFGRRFFVRRVSLGSAQTRKGADGPFARPGLRSARSAIADTYWHIAHQDPSAWTLDIDLRPFKKKF
jgi:hypothetical protein